MVTALRVIAGVFVAGGAIAFFAFVNAARQRRDVRAVLAQRRSESHAASSNPFAILTAQEVDALTFTSSRSWVFATRILGDGIPDPWRAQLDVEPSLYAVLANRLRENSLIAQVYVDIALVLSSGFVGVAASQVVAAISSSRSVYGAIILLIVPLVIASAAVLFRVTAVQDWQAAAAQYKALARNAETRFADPDRDASQPSGRRSRVAPSTISGVGTAVTGVAAGGALTLMVYRYVSRRR